MKSYWELQNIGMGRNNNEKKKLSPFDSSWNDQMSLSLVVLFFKQSTKKAFSYLKLTFLLPKILEMFYFEVFN